METQILAPTEEAVALAARILREGGLVGLPTETVYGLGANALDEAAVRAIFAAKGLPQPPVEGALHTQTQALARTVSAARLLDLYDFLGVLTDRISRNAAAAAVTCALTSDAYRICFL